MGGIGVLVIELQVRLRQGLLILVGLEDPHGRFLRRCNRGVRLGWPDQIPSRRSYALQQLFLQRIVSH